MDGILSSDAVIAVIVTAAEMHGAVDIDVDVDVYVDIDIDIDTDVDTYDKYLWGYATSDGMAENELNCID